MKWKTVELGEVLTLKRGYDLPKRMRKEGLVPIISSAGISGYHNEAKAAPPGVVIGRYGTIGNVFFTDDDYWPLNTSLYVKDFKGNDPKYISFLLETINYYEYSDKAAVPGVNRNHLHKALVTIPENIDDQRAIAAKIAVLDDKIALNRRTNATLEALAQALFRAWFVDYEPVRAKLAAKRLSRDPERVAMAAIGGKLRVPRDAEARLTVEDLDTALAELDQLTEVQQAELARTAGLFPGALVDSELGEVPAGWVVRCIGDVVDVSDYVANGSFKSLKENVNFLDSGGYAFYLRTTDFKNGYNKEKRFVDEESYNFLSKTKLFGREVIISNVGDVGTVFRPPSWLGFRMTLGSNAVSLVGTGISNEYLFKYFNSERGQHLLKSITTGSAQLKFNKTNLRSSNIIMPTSALMGESDKHFNATNELINNILATNVKLSELRDNLLPELLNQKNE